MTIGQPLLHFYVANGFAVESYRPLLDRVSAWAHVFALPPRPLWIPQPSPASLTSWQDLAVDLLNNLDRDGRTDVIAVGHSLGGIVSMLAVIRQPARFRALIMLDPVILPPPVLRMMRRAQRTGTADLMPLVQGALRRKAIFASPDEAFTYWRGKPLFVDWSDEALHRYTQTALITVGDELHLHWPPEWEARLFATGHTSSWRDLARLSSTGVPTLLIHGGKSDTLLPACAARIRDRYAYITVRELPDGRHLFPHTAPDETADLIESWLADRALR